MTHSIELARIESAIENRDEDELRWAMNYCKMRLSEAVLKEHVHFWKRIEKEVVKVLNRSN
jgi:hypothetical protein